MIWSRWPSFVVESAAGILLQVGPHLLRYLLHKPAEVWEYLLIGVGMSLLYEAFLDVNGWSTRDVLERVPAQVLTELVFLALR